MTRPAAVRPMQRKKNVKRLQPAAQRYTSSASMRRNSSIISIETAVHSPTPSVKSLASPLATSRHLSAPSLWSPLTTFTTESRPQANDADKRTLDIFKIVKSRSSPLLALFNDEELKNIADSCEVLHLQPSEVFMFQGDSSSSMFIVLQGEVNILVDDTGSCSFQNASKVDAVQGVVGEVGMLTGQRREAFAQAGSNACIVLQVTLSEVRAISLRRIELRAQLVSLMADVRRQKNGREKHRKSSTLELDRRSPSNASPRSSRAQSRRQDLAGIAGVANIVKRTAQKLEQQEERTLNQVLLTAESWIEENKTVIEEYECRPLVSLLVQHPLVMQMYVPNKGISLLHKAAEIGNVFVCSQLIHYGCPLNMLDSRHRSVLHHAVEGSNISRGDGFETLRLLLECGAVQMRDAEGDAPGDISARDDVRLLLAQHLRDKQLSECALSGCSRKPLVLCKICKLAKYCCVDHLRTDWIAHNDRCAPSREGEESVLSPQALNALLRTHRKVNNMSLQKDWQIRKSFGISIAEYSSRQHKKTYLMIWIRYVWIVKANLSLIFQEIVADSPISSPDFFLEISATSAQRQFQVEIMEKLSTDKDVLKTLSIPELKTLCLHDFAGIRKCQSQYSVGQYSSRPAQPIKPPVRGLRKSSILLVSALILAGKGAGKSP